MREIVDLTDDEREKLKRLMPKALDLIDAQYVNNGRLETELAFFVGKVERIDVLPDEWRERCQQTGDAERAAALTECSEELSDILGGSGGRIERLRADGVLPAKDAETAPENVPFVLRGAVRVTSAEQRRRMADADPSTFCESLARDLERRNRPPKGS